MSLKTWIAVGGATLGVAMLGSCGHEEPARDRARARERAEIMSNNCRRELGEGDAKRFDQAAQTGAALARVLDELESVDRLFSTFQSKAKIPLLAASDRVSRSIAQASIDHLVDLALAECALARSESAAGRGLSSSPTAAAQGRELCGDADSAQPPVKRRHPSLSRDSWTKLDVGNIVAEGSRADVRAWVRVVAGLYDPTTGRELTAEDASRLCRARARAVNIEDVVEDLYVCVDALALELGTMGSTGHESVRQCFVEAAAESVQEADRAVPVVADHPNGVARPSEGPPPGGWAHLGPRAPLPERLERELDRVLARGRRIDGEITRRLLEDKRAEAQALALAQTIGLDEAWARVRHDWLGDAAARLERGVRPGVPGPGSPGSEELLALAAATLPSFGLGQGSEIAVEGAQRALRARVGESLARGPADRLRADWQSQVRLSERDDWDRRDFEHFLHDVTVAGFGAQDVRAGFADAWDRAFSASHIDWELWRPLASRLLSALRRCEDPQEAVDAARLRDFMSWGFRVALGDRLELARAQARRQTAELAGRRAGAVSGLSLEEQGRPLDPDVFFSLPSREMKNALLEATQSGLLAGAEFEKQVASLAREALWFLKPIAAGIDDDAISRTGHAPPGSRAAKCDPSESTRLPSSPGGARI